MAETGEYLEVGTGEVLNADVFDDVEEFPDEIEARHAEQEDVLSPGE